LHMAAYITLMPSCPFGVCVTAQRRCLWHRPPCAPQPQRRLRRSVRGGNDGRSAESDACTSAHTCASPTAIGSIEHERRRACACVLRPRSLALTRTHSSCTHLFGLYKHIHDTHARARAHTHTHTFAQTILPSRCPSLAEHPCPTHACTHACPHGRTHAHLPHAHPTHARWLASTHTFTHARRHMV
jgi:hypothetical protein